MMQRNVVVSLAIFFAIGVAVPSLARADCESDLLQLEQAYKTPDLTPAARGALDDAKIKSVKALKKDDDAGCHKAIAEGMAKAGLVLK